MKPASLIPILVCLLAAITIFFISPPAALVSRGTSSGQTAQNLAAVLVLTALIPVLRWSQSRHRPVWINVTSTATLLSIVVYVIYWTQSDDWTCVYARTRVVIGSQLTADGARYRMEHPELTCKDLINDYAGNLEEIWTKASIDRTRHWLAGLYTLALALAGWALVGLTQFAVAARATTIASTDRLKVRVFISYRREDTLGFVDRLRDHLIKRLEPGYVIRDIQSFVPGEDFRQATVQAIDECDVLLAVIGPLWLSVTEPDGTRRLDNPSDPVRTEIETALKLRRRVIPLLHNTQMPRLETLPATLVRLNSITALYIRDDPDFDGDFEQLIAALRV